MKVKRKVRKMPIVLGIVGIVLLALAALAGWYLHRNKHYDEALMRAVWDAGFTEKQATRPDGTVLNYGEGPDNGPALLLIHGQSVAWEDYDAVLPTLSKSFHIYAVDCYGHGGSSHEETLYSCQVNGKAIVWFIENVIGGNCYLSGHSSGGVLAAWIAANAPDRIDGVVLEDPPLFRVTPEEIREGKGAFAWYDSYVTTHEFLGQSAETDYPLFYLKNGYFTTMFGGLKEPVVRAAVRYRLENPERPIQIAWLPGAWQRMLLYMDDYDPRFGNAFYDGSWMAGVDQATVLTSIRCPVVYLKASTNYGKDGVLYAANAEADAVKVASLIPDCERVDVKSGHDVHFEHPDAFVSACEMLLMQD